MRACSLVLTLVMALSRSFVMGQTTQTSDANEAADLSLDHGIRLLSNVRDHVFTFDDPGFYWFCRYVREDTDAEKYDENVKSPTPSRQLMERPSDYRGALVQIEGKLLRTGAFEVSNRAGVGRLFQCEIGEQGSRAICTSVLTEDPGDLPVGSVVRVRGYFIKARSFQTTGGDSGSGPLVVSKRLHRTGDSSGAQGSDIETNGNAANKWLLTGTAVLFIVWIALRRGMGGREERSLRSVNRQPISETHGDFDWMVNGEPAPPEPSKNAEDSNPSR